MTGTIRMLKSDKGYGFIVGDNGQDFFFHMSALKNVQFKELESGDPVEFEDEESDKGLKAVEIWRR